MKNPKVIVIEYFSHFKVLENTYHLLHNECDLTFYFSSYKNEGALGQFPSRTLVTYENKKKPAYISFWPLIWKCKKYDHVYISTGPQSSHITTWLTLIQFFLIIIFYKKKITLTMRSIRDYLPVKGKIDIFTYLRSKMVKLINRFTFETPANCRNYIKDSNRKNILCAVSYDRYTDFFPEKFQKKSAIAPNSRIRIGLLGVVSNSTKDYLPVINAIKLLSNEEKDILEFINIAYCPLGSENEIVKEIKQHCKISIKDGFLDTDEFDQLGSTCHLLLSPLKKEIEYGTYKGSGTFGDMVYLQRRTLMPRYCDPDGDYDKISHYYSDEAELARLFKDAHKISEMNIDKEFIKSFSTKNIREKVFKDLRFC